VSHDEHLERRFVPDPKQAIRDPWKTVDHMMIFAIIAAFALPVTVIALLVCALT